MYLIACPCTWPGRRVAAATVRPSCIATGARAGLSRQPAARAGGRGRARRSGRRGHRPGPHFPDDDRQVGGRTLQSLGAEGKKCLARSRRRLTDGRTASRQAGAAAGAAGVRTARRVAVDDGDLSGIDAELFSRHLRNGDAHAGADVDFARVDRDRAVGVDCEKAVDFVRVEWPARRALDGLSGLSDRRQAAAEPTTSPPTA